MPGIIWHNSFSQACSRTGLVSCITGYMSELAGVYLATTFIADDHPFLYQLAHIINFIYRQ
jgi:hypothetical protein